MQIKMKRKRMYFIIYVIIAVSLNTFFILKFLSSDAQANEFRRTIGKSIIYAPTGQAVNRLESFGNIKDQLHFNYGISYTHKNLFASLTTNRLSNRSITTAQKNSGQVYQVKTKFIQDTLSLGKVHGRFLTSLLITNGKLNKEVYIRDNLVSHTSKQSIMIGLNGGFFITKKHLVSLFYFPENKDMEVRKVVGLNYSYLF
jgi:ABC-type dipeptide/oligopeptide/nickel transport system permease component